ncbi:SAFB-like transcription modulator isoform X2 [Neocloeon triangulifer]|uniref:SAFB-like transcription modulator isoform X2 n=1 Tax=Neocloeon triangulifer TaxID=2078957 RepID=UPI00286F4D8B|nr:SAFB-like transcription modulator isoform X2 [Neocloeon triangulifer]
MSDVEKRKLSQARVADLRAELEKRGLDKSGVKAVLVERLVASLASDGLSSSEIDEYVVESAHDGSFKRQTKRSSVTPSKSKDEDEIMNELDDRPEVLDYGENEDLDNSNAKDDSDEQGKASEKYTPYSAKSAEADDFKVLDEEAFDDDDADADKEEQQENCVEHDDSIDLGLNEDMLIEEEVNSFGAESDVPASNQNRKRHQQEKGRKSQSSSEAKEEAPQKPERHQDSHTGAGGSSNSSGGGGDASSKTSEKKTSSPKQDGSNERSSKTLDEKSSSDSNQPQQSEKEAVNGDKSRSSGSPKDKSKSTSDDKRDSSPSASNSSGRNLWVSGLSSSTRATDLKQTFSKYGKVLGAKVVTNAKTPGARCYGFVTMAKKEDAQRCIQHLDRTELHGRMISVERARGEATGPGRVKTPSPSKKEGKFDDKDSEKKESSSKSNSESSKDQRRDSRDSKGNKPVRQRITAPSPGPSTERSVSRSDSRSDQGKKRPRSIPRSISPKRPAPPRRVNHSPGGGLHTRRSTTAVLTFASIKQARERQRIRDREREDREHARRREEEVRRLERRQREEQQKLEREKEELRLERERIEKARKDILRLEREKAKLERERLEWEREELKRQQQKLRELAERPPLLTSSHTPSVSASRPWSSYSSVGQSDQRFDDVRRSSSNVTGTKRQGSHHSADYYEERAAKRPVPSSSDERRVNYDSAQAVPPPPRFSSIPTSSSSMKRPADSRRDHNFANRNSSSAFERTSTSVTSGSVGYDRTTTSSGRREGFFPSSSSSSAGRVVEPSRREVEPTARGKDERYRDTSRPTVRNNDRQLSGREPGNMYMRGPPPSASISSSSSRPRERYGEGVGRGIAGSSAAREPWLDRKSDNSTSDWPRSTDTSSADRWSSNNVGSRGGGNIYNPAVSNLGIGLGAMGGAPQTTTLYGSSERFDAYKQPMGGSLRKY